MINLLTTSLKEESTKNSIKNLKGTIYIRNRKEPAEYLDILIKRAFTTII